ncbi:MAG: hypothetical protein IIA82_10930 [Thaumarchaeota archaeon]|nr:hypothetical protein [Nitrososphaerota archaeon]
MSEEVKKKFEEFAKRMESDEDVFKLLDEMDVFKLLDEMDAYMKGICDSTTNYFTKSELTGFMMDLIIFRGVLLGFNKTGDRFAKMQTDLNSALERINKLEQKKPLDDPESMK